MRIQRPLALAFLALISCRPAAKTAPPVDAAASGGRVEKEIRPETYDVEHREGFSGFTALYRRAASRLDADDVAGARDAYKEAQRLEPTSAEPLIGLGTCALHDQQFAAARALYNNALALDDHSTLAHIGLGSAWYRERHFADSAREYEAAAALDEKNPDAHWGAATAYLALGQNNQARAHAARFLVLAPTSALVPRARKIAAAWP